MRRSIVPSEAILRPVSCPEPVWGVTIGGANRSVPQFILGGSNDRMPWWGQWPQGVQARAGSPRPRHACLAQSDCPNAWTLCYKAWCCEGQWAEEKWRCLQWMWREYWWGCATLTGYISREDVCYCCVVLGIILIVKIVKVLLVIVIFIDIIIVIIIFIG